MSRASMGDIVEFPRPRRRSVRTPLYQPVALVHDNASVATATAVNVSTGGMQVLCDRLTVDSLHRSDQPLDGADAPGIDAHFRLPLAEGLAKVDVHCRLVYVQTVAEGACLVGLEFVALRDEGVCFLERFVNEAEALGT